MSFAPEEQNILKLALSEAKRSMKTVLLFSLVVNILLLTSPLFMLQVYDRVLLSRSESTLMALFAVAIFLLCILLFIEITRNYLLNRISVRFDESLSTITFSEIMARGNVTKPIHDLNSIRNFLNAPFLLALFDIPWLPVYLGLVYFLHPYLGHVGLIGALLLFIVAVSNDILTREPSQKSNEYFGSANSFMEHSAQNRDTILGMGMLRSLSRIWSSFQSAGLGFQIQASDKNAVLSALAKVIRQIIQVSVLAVGGYLVIIDTSTAGVMIAASIIVGRALAPIEQSIQGWRSFTKVKESYQNLSEFLDAYDLPEAKMPLPTPKAHLKFQNVVAFGVSPPHATSSDGQGQPKPVIKNVSFELQPGEVLGITGPSGAGKSTLIKLALGIIRPISGTVSLDGAELTGSVQNQFAPYFGYLPQNVFLFDGTVAENIARFTDADPEKIIEAAKLAGAHELIVALPEGYETPVGIGGITLSGGQLQRIGLARAVFGQPSLIILDEPTSNLDLAGRQAYLDTVKRLKQQGVTLIVIAHQSNLFESMDKLALISDGQIQHFGPINEVKAAMNAQHGAASKKAEENKAIVKKTIQIKPSSININKISKL